MVRLALLLALAALVVPACGEGRRPRVTLIGDSLLHAAGSRVEDAFEAGEIRVDGVPGAKLGDRLAAIRRAAADGPEGLVIELGTNDVIWDDHVDGDLASEIASALEITASVPCVRWVEVRELNDATRTFNRMVREAVAERPNADVVPWAARAADRDEWHDDDRVHHSEAGLDAFAAMLVDTARGCVTGAWRARGA